MATTEMANRAKMRTIEKTFAIAAMILVSEVWGFGLNNLYGLQTIGSPFYAEIPIQSAPTVSRQCTAIKPMPGETELFIADLQVDVAGPPNAQRLIISSRSTVRAPIVSFVVEVNCPDASMSREYTVLAENPSSRKLTATRDSISAAPNIGSRPQVMAIPTPVGPAPANAVATNSLVMQVPTTLNAMARLVYPGDRKSRDAYRAAFAAANPSLFGGVKHVGSVVIAAGTTLQLPAGVAVPPNIPAVAQASRAPAIKAPKISAPASASPSGGRDRLTLGVATPQLKMLADAISHIEGMAAERDKVQSELVGGVSGSLNAVIELKNRLAAQELQMRQLIELQVETERRRVKDKESELGLLGILALLLSAVAMTAGLVILHHFLATRRQRFIDQQRVEPSPVVGAVAERATESAPEAETQPVPEPEPEPVPEPEPEPVPELEPEPAPEPAKESVPEPVPEFVPDYVEYVPATVAQSNEATNSPAQTESEVEILLPPAAIKASFDDWSGAVDVASPETEVPPATPPENVMPSFLSTGNEITELAGLLRESENPDPAQCFNLVRTVRATWLMTDPKFQDVLSKFRRIFNADVIHENDGRGLDVFQRVLTAINNTWGRSEGLTYLSSLIYDDRGGEREGFPENAFEEAILLNDILKTRIAMFGEDQAEEPEVAPVMFSLDLPPPKTSSE